MEETRSVAIRFWKSLSQNWLPKFHGIALSLNISCSLAYALLIYVYRNMALPLPVNDSGYYLLRGTASVGDIVHSGQIASVSTAAAARQADPPWTLEELTVFASVLAVTALLALFFRLCPRPAGSRSLRERAEGFAALFALPVCSLAVSRLTWGWQPEPGGLPSAASLFWQCRELKVFLAEILCLGIGFVVFRKRAVSRWLFGSALLVHYGFWIPTLWEKGWIFAPYFFLLPPLVSGVFWMFYINRSPISSDQAGDHTRPSRAIWTAAILALAVLLAIWLPKKGFSLTRALDVKSIVVQLSRGPCYGRCPNYTMTIHGNGMVEYIGIKNVRVRGPQSSKVSSEQLRQMLEILDRAHFSTLEDRAFMWCFDTSSVAVSIAVDGRVKRVTSDGGCIGAKSGLQAGFVRAADELDNIAGSDKWVKCDEEHCR